MKSTRSDFFESKSGKPMRMSELPALDLNSLPGARMIPKKSAA